jgi:anti-anti-sigma factor
VVEFGGFGISVTRDRNPGPTRAEGPVVAVNGEVDTATSPRLEQALAEALDAGPPVVWVDLAGVTFMDASGVGVLVSAAKRAQDLGGRLTLCAPSSAVLRVLDAADLQGLLNPEP